MRKTSFELDEFHLKTFLKTNRFDVQQKNEDFSFNDFNRFCFLFFKIKEKSWGEKNQRIDNKMNKRGQKIDEVNRGIDHLLMTIFI